MKCECQHPKHQGASLCQSLLFLLGGGRWNCNVKSGISREWTDLNPERPRFVVPKVGGGCHGKRVNCHGGNQPGLSEGKTGVENEPWLETLMTRLKHRQENESGRWSGDWSTNGWQAGRMCVACGQEYSQTAVEHSPHLCGVPPPFWADDLQGAMEWPADASPGQTLVQQLLKMREELEQHLSSNGHIGEEDDSYQCQEGVGSSQQVIIIVAIVIDGPICIILFGICNFL